MKQPLSKPQVPNPLRAQLVDLAEHVQEERLLRIERISHLLVGLQHLTEPMRLGAQLGHMPGMRKSLGDSPLLCIRLILHNKLEDVHVSVQHRKISHAASVKARNPQLVLELLNILLMLTLELLNILLMLTLELLNILLMLVFESYKPIFQHFNILAMSIFDALKVLRNPSIQFILLRALWTLHPPRATCLVRNNKTGRTGLNNSIFYFRK